MRLVLFVCLVLLLSIPVFAQIDSDTIVDSGAKCGNGVREPFEPCDLSSSADDADKCPQIGAVLKIAMVCRTELCSCLPRKYIICGDKHTKGNEVCDTPDVDYCPQVSDILGAKVECNSKTCLCKAAEGAIVKPEVPEVNITELLCGNRQVDNDEECDPPGRQCSFEGVDGVCADDCSCKALASEDELLSSEQSVVEPLNGSIKTSVETASSENSVDDSSPPTAMSTRETEFVEPAEVVSDTTYTIILIVLVVVFILGLAFGSFFMYKRSQVGDFDGENSGDGKKQDDE